MSTNPFEGQETIYDNVDVLEPDTKTYKPDRLPEREKELEEIHSLLKPVTMGGTPRHGIVYGPTGQGKTVGMKIKTDQLQNWAKETEEVDLTVVHIRCKGCDNSYHVLTQLVKELREVRRGPGEDKPSGYTQKTLVEMAFEELEKIGGAIILILDEIDAIGDDDYVLYELPRASLEKVKLGVIGITNDLQFRDSLDADVRSSLGRREVVFSPYQPQHLRNILARRAANALRDTEFTGETDVIQNLESDILEEGVIPLCAALAAQETGDARDAIELFSETCSIADSDIERTSRQMITEEHVREAYEKLERQAVSDGIRHETTQRKLALLTVTHTELIGDSPAETATLYEKYQNYCSISETNVRSEYTFRDKLNDLVKSNILNKEHRGRGQKKGTTNTYSLNVSTDIVLDETENDSHLVDIVDELKTRYA